MAITNGYCTLAEFKQRFNITTTDTNRDTDLEKIIEAVCRRIDYETQTVFYASSAGVQRYFPTPRACKVWIDDCTAITAVSVDTNRDGTADLALTASTDYLLGPINGGPALATVYQYIEIAPWSTSGGFPVGNPRGVAVTGTWGNSTVAAVDLVREATLLQANRLWARRAAPFGVIGANEFGVPTTITRLDPDVVEMLAPVSRKQVWG